MKETAAYERLLPLQGVCVPRLLAAGFTDEPAYFVATEYIEVWKHGHQAWPISAPLWLIVSAGNLLNCRPARFCLHA